MRRQLAHGSCCGSGQALEEFTQICLSIDPDAVAVADQGVERGRAVAAVSVSHEQPVVPTDGARADRVLHEVGVDLQADVTQVHGYS